MQERYGERGRTSGERKGLLHYLFSRESRYLPLILTAQLAFLVGLVMLAFILPLSGSQRWVVVGAAGVLAGLTWAVLDHLKQK